MNRRKIFTAWRDQSLLQCEPKEMTRLIKAQIRISPELEPLILEAGARRLMSAWRKEFAPLHDPHIAESARIKSEEKKIAFRAFVQEVETNASKAKNFDRIVEMLDHKAVGNKLLGDCTRSDLLRAAVAAETLAGEATIEAGFYRLLAGMIGQGTVRQASDRGKIVALLTQTFQEAA